MGLSDFWRNRRRSTFRPQIESLETRECPSVTVPTGVQATALSSTQVKLTWSDVSGEVGYRVYRWDGARPTLLATLGANTTTFTVNQLAAARSYYFQIEVFDQASRARTALIYATTQRDAIAAPTNVRVVAGTVTQVTLMWNPAAGAMGYRIFGRDGSRTFLAGTTNNTTNSFTIRNLSPGRVYSFSVEAFNATNSASSDWVAGSVQAPSLTAPTNVQVQLLDPNTAKLNWTDSNNETGYRIYRVGNGSTPPTVIATLSANTTSYQLDDLQSSTSYTFYVQAFNAVRFADSAQVTVTTPAGQPLQVPANIQVKATSTYSALLSWTDSVGATGYRIYYWVGYTWALLTVVPQGARQAVIAPLGASRLHWFMIQAYDDNNRSVNSNPIFLNL